MIALLALLTLAAKPAALETVAEQSQWVRTGRYAEVLRLCDDFPKAFPGKVRCEKFGVTPEGRPMVALVASADGALDPKVAALKKRPVVLWQGGIHAGEIDGKDAGFWLLRDVLRGQVLPGVLSKVTIVFVPVFNVDGHERFGANHRPNQRGPEQMGWRVTAQNYNLNRDYAKAEAPEMAAMLRLLQRWDPILYVDLHVTDGAQFQHDVSVLIEPIDGQTNPLTPVALAARASVFQELEAEGHTPLDFYPSFIKEDEPSSGFARGLAPPRFQSTYWMLRNRVAALVETHSWKDYAGRVKSTHDVLQALLRQAADHGGQWLAAAKDADEADRHPQSLTVALSWKNTDAHGSFAFKGYAYTVQPSEISGRPWISYDETKPQVWNVPLYDELKVDTSADAPAAGYLIPAAHAAWVGEKLKLHGFAYRKLNRDLPALEVDAFRVTQVEPLGTSFEGRVPVRVSGAWKKEKRDVPAGSLFVPANQPGRALLVHLLDPTGPDSFAAWGFFDAAFEIKDGMETYVVEAEARKMLAANPALNAEFNQKIAADPAFAKSPEARLTFFRSRHPSWDDRYNLYPVYRLATAP